MLDAGVPPIRILLGVHVGRVLGDPLRDLSQGDLGASVSGPGYQSWPLGNLV